MAKKAYEIDGSHTSFLTTLPGGKTLHLHGDAASYETSDEDEQRALDQMAATAGSGLKAAAKGGGK